MIFPLKKKKVLRPKAEQVFEVAWEVCNKVGGIYTVLVSKAPQMLKYYGKGKYWLVGPYFAERVKGEFAEEAPPLKLKKVFSRLAQEQGIICHFGKWLIEGQPQVILLDFQALWPKANQLKEKLWQDFGVDSLTADSDFTEPLLWAHSAGLLLEELAHLWPAKKMTAHFHEWLSAAGLLLLKSRKKTKIALVFTSHATTLGRTLASNWRDPYQTNLDALLEARQYNVQAKHLLEKAGAHNCHVFSTVSEISGEEAANFLGRRPDVLLLNGLDSEHLLSFDELILKHRLQRNRLKEFLLFYFFPYYTFDLKKTLFYFISGRYEVKAKGIDVCLKALAGLNEKLLVERSKKTIVAFLWIPSQTTAVRTELLENKQFLEDIKDSLKEVAEETEEKLLYTIAEGRPFSEQALFGDKFLFEIKKKLVRLKRKGLPPLSTHSLADPNDYILKTLAELGLNNQPESRVKVVFYPAYLNGHDGLLNLNYQESIEGCDLGAFPSLYEPWGYTPLETAGAGVSAITCDTAGFGRFCQPLITEPKQPGVFVLKRFQRSDSEVVKDLADIFYRYSKSSRRQRVENKMEARKIAALADWKILAANYLTAHNLAIEKAYKQ